MTIPSHYGELTLILLLGLLQPVIEIGVSAQVAAGYNVVAVLIVLTYLGWRITQQPGILREWGVRLDNFGQCVLPYFLFSIPATAVIYAYGWYLGTTPLPHSFWYLLVLYPVWGFVQQFALQNLVARNLVGLVPNLLVRSLMVATVFSLAHTPSLELMLLAFLVGFCFTLLYDRCPNLFALGIAHGFLGALVFYLVLGQDQWEILRGYFSLFL